MLRISPINQEEMKTMQRRYTYIYSLALDLLLMRKSNCKKLWEPCGLCVLYLSLWAMQLLQQHVWNAVLVQANSTGGCNGRQLQHPKGLATGASLQKMVAPSWRLLSTTGVWIRLHRHHSLAALCNLNSDSPPISCPSWVLQRSLQPNNNQYYVFWKQELLDEGLCNFLRAVNERSQTNNTCHKMAEELPMLFLITEEALQQNSEKEIQIW